MWLRLRWVFLVELLLLQTLLSWETLRSERRKLWELWHRVGLWYTGCHWRWASFFLLLSLVWLYQMVSWREEIDLLIYLRLHRGFWNLTTVLDYFCVVIQLQLSFKYPHLFFLVTLLLFHFRVFVAELLKLAVSGCRRNDLTLSETQWAVLSVRYITRFCWLAFDLLILNKWLKIIGLYDVLLIISKSFDGWNTCWFCSATSFWKFIYKWLLLFFSWLIVWSIDSGFLFGSFYIWSFGFKFCCAFSILFASQRWLSQRITTHLVDW